MAPFNLSDLAVKEIKISPKHLAPAAEKNYTGNFLLAHFIDFWALFWTTTISVAIFKNALTPFIATKKLMMAWNLTDLTAGTLFTWTAFAFSYFFFSYFFNAGQTWGMKFTKTRISIHQHDARSSLRWAVFSLSVIFSMGLTYKKGLSLLASWGTVKAHDHLWHELVAQKEMAAPDVMTLVKEESAEEFAEAA